MNSYFINTGLFFFDTILNLYILLLLLRLLFQLVGAEFYNPISQLVVKLSNPILNPLHRLVPTIRSIDCAAILLLVILEGARISIAALSMGHTPQLLGIVTLSIAKLVQLSVYVMVVALFVRVLLSWIGGAGDHFFLRLIHSLTEPLMNKARRLLPKTGVIDFSPIAVFVVLMLVLKLFVEPFLTLGRILI